MSLVEYRRKRHFGKTREPAPGEAVEAKRAIFVVHDQSLALRVPQPA